jgi:hypothetical protein
VSRLPLVPADTMVSSHETEPHQDRSIDTISLSSGKSPLESDMQYGQEGPMDTVWSQTRSIDGKET